MKPLPDEAQLLWSNFIVILIFTVFWAVLVYLTLNERNHTQASDEVEMLS